MIQLTWQEHTALVYDLADFNPVATFTYDTRGMGPRATTARAWSSVTAPISCTSATARRLPYGAIIGRERKRIGGGLNELECVGGQVYANVLSSDTILRIDPSSGAVTATIDASGLLTEDEAAGASVLNGIAYEPDGRHVPAYRQALADPVQGPLRARVIYSSRGGQPEPQGRRSVPFAEQRKNRVRGATRMETSHHVEKWVLVPVPARMRRVA